MTIIRFKQIKCSEDIFRIDAQATKAFEYLMSINFTPEKYRIAYNEYGMNDYGDRNK